MANINKNSDSKYELVNNENEQGGDSKPAMVPIFSRRSIIILSVGLIVGILIAFGYWLISPLFNSGADQENQADSNNTGLQGMLGIESGGPYRSTVSVQIVNPGPSAISRNSLLGKGEYLATRVNSPSFYEFLSQELENYAFETEYTIDELTEIIKMEYDYTSEFPAIEVSATADTEEEATFLGELVHQVFLDYLIAEDKEKRDRQYTDTLEELELVKEALYEAHQEVSALQSPDILDNPSYISLSAKVEALQKEYDNQLSLLALEYYGDTGLQDEYENTLEEITTIVTELIKAEQDLLDVSEQDTNNLLDNADILILESKIRGLQNELDLLISGDELTPSLSYYISNDISSGVQYNTLMDKINKTALSLAEARQEYNEVVNSSIGASTAISLEQQLAQIKVDTLSNALTASQEKLATLYTQIIGLNIEDGNSESKFNTISLALNDAKYELETLENQLGYNQQYADIELILAEDRVSYYNDRITSLNEQLVSLIGNNEELLQIFEYLLVNEPSIPFVVPTERPAARITLLVGAIAGIIIAWIAINFKWLIHLASNSGLAKPDDDDY